MQWRFAMKCISDYGKLMRALRPIQTLQFRMGYLKCSGHVVSICMADTSLTFLPMMEGTLKFTSSPESNHQRSPGSNTQSLG